MPDIGITINCVFKKEHVPDIEWFNFTFKERARYACAAMPLTHISKIMIAHLSAAAIFWLKTFPPSKTDTGLYDTKVPVKCFLETVVDYKKVCGLQTGKYFQVHQED